MMNAKKELIEFIAESKKEIAAAEVVYGSEWNDNRKAYSLPLGGDVKRFFEALNFEYDNGWGGQELFGTLWFKDGTWAERGEYDGSEWWELREPPEIPVHLLGDYHA